LNIIRSFLSDSAVYSISGLLSKGISFFLIPLYTSVLSPSDYGLLDIYLIFSNVVIMTFGFEITQALARYYTSDSDIFKKKLMVSTSLWFMLFSYLVFVVIVLLYNIKFSSLIFGEVRFTTLVWGIFYTASYAFYNFFQNLLRWQLRPKSYLLVSVLYSVLTALFGVYFAYYSIEGLNGFIKSMFFSSLISSFFAFFLVNDLIVFRFNFKVLSTLLKFSIPLIPGGIAVWANNYADRFMLRELSSLEEVGLFGIAFRLSGLILLLMSGFQTAFSPLMYSNYSNNDSRNSFSIIFNAYVALLLFLYTFLIFFSNDILDLLTQPEFIRASDAVVFLIPSIILSQLYVFVPGIFIAGKTYYVMIFNLIGLILNIFGNYILVPHYGFVGASVSTFVSQIVVFLLYVLIGNIYYRVNYKFYSLTLVFSVVFTSNFIQIIYCNDVYSRLVVLFFVVLFQFGLTLRLKLIEKVMILKIYNFLVAKVKHILMKFQWRGVGF